MCLTFLLDDFDAGFLGRLVRQGQVFDDLQGFTGSVVSRHLTRAAFANKLAWSDLQRHVEQTGEAGVVVPTERQAAVTLYTLQIERVWFTTLKLTFILSLTYLCNN